MKRYISIFAFLLGAFAAVGLPGSATFAAESAVTCWVISSHSTTMFTYAKYADPVEWKFTELSADSKGYYESGTSGQGIGATQMLIYPGAHIETSELDGYDFDGWYTKKDGWSGTILSAIDQITAEREIYCQEIGENAGEWNRSPTIVAKYEIITFKVTFDGTSEEIKDIPDQNIDSTIPLPSASKGGYNFAGWKNDKGKTFNAGDYKGSEFWNGTDRKFHADLTAQWTGKTYSIVLDRDGGTGGSCPSEYTVSESSQELAITLPTKEGHTIQGWTVSGATGGSPSVSGTTLTIPANTYENLTLKPNWQPDTFTITYKPGSGTPGNEYADTKDWGKDKALRGKTYEDPKGQYVQDGWNTTKESFEGEPDYGLKAAYTDNASITLYPHWKLNGYKLTIHHKGAYYDGKLLEETALESLVVGTTNLNEILVAVPTNDAAFYGYYSSEGGSTQIYDEHGKCCKVEGFWSEMWAKGGTFEGSADLEVWAKWGPPPEHCTIRAVCDPADGGTVEPASTNVVKGRDVTLTATPNDGYSFCCWTNETGDVVSLNHHDTFTITNNATYTAVFTGNVYKVYYNGAGGLPDFQEKSVRYGETYGDPPAAVTQAGFNFEGWYTKTQGRGTRVNGTDPVAVLGEEGLDLYANWTAKTEFDVIWVDPTGRNASITNSPIAKDTTISAAPEATANWYRNWDGEYWISGWNPSLPQTVTGDLTLTALRMSISDVLDCSNLVFTVGTSKWKPVDDSTAKNGSCMRLDASSGDNVLATSVSTNGTLSFRWKGGKSSVKLWLRTGGADSGCFELESSDTWKDESIFIENASSEKIEIGFHLLSEDLSLSYCAIDSVAWVPGGETPVPPPVALHRVIFHDPSGTFDDEAQDVEPGSVVTAPDWTSDKFDPMSCGWDKDFSQVMEDITVNAVWTCRVEFVDLEGGNLPVTNKVGYGQEVVAPTTFTPPVNKHFGGWKPSMPGSITSNSVFTVVWTDNPTYTVTYSWDKETQTDTKKQGVPLTLKVAIFTRAGYEQDGWSKSPDGSVKDFEFGGTYSDDADLTLYPTWKELKPVVVDEIARALDCEGAGLTFELAGGWSVFTNESFAQKGISCLSNNTDNATVTVTIPQSGTLTFYWCGRGSSSYAAQLHVFVNDERVGDPLTAPKSTPVDWPDSPVSLDVSQGDVVVFKNEPRAGKYTALDHFTWTPEGGGEPTPGESVKPTAAGVENGVFSLTIPTTSGTDYGVWTNADLTADSWGLMGKPQPGDGNPWKVKWTILPELPQLFFRAHKVVYK